MDELKKLSNEWFVHVFEDLFPTDDEKRKVLLDVNNEDLFYEEFRQVLYDTVEYDLTNCFIEWLISKDFEIDFHILPTLRMEINVYRIDEYSVDEQLSENASLEDILLAWIDYYITMTEGGRQTLVMKYLPQQ